MQVFERSLNDFKRNRKRNVTCERDARISSRWPFFKRFEPRGKLDCKIWKWRHQHHRHNSECEESGQKVATCIFNKFELLLSNFPAFFQVYCLLVNICGDFLTHSTAGCLIDRLSFSCIISCRALFVCCAPCCCESRGHFHLGLRRLWPQDFRRLSEVQRPENSLAFADKTFLRFDSLGKFLRMKSMTAFQ